MKRIAKQTFILMVIATLFCYCSSTEKQTEKDQAYRKELADRLYRNKNEDSLKLMLQQFIEENNDLGAMLCYKQLGLFLRENARFFEAINHHQEGLGLALKLKDTVEIVQALNNLGTDFRRIGAQGEASEYHYRALEYADTYSQAGVPGNGMKNRVVSLNGIGNVSLTLGYLDDAEKNFRLALVDEIKMKSPIGQAINYANLGAIFEQRQQLDSARAYYKKSLEQNRIANSDMGIGLCLIHLGELYEKEKDYAQAKAEFQKAYDLMAEISDRWHWLEACLSIARINLLENNIPEFNKYIDLSEKTANQINSPEHLADVHTLKHDYYVKQNDYRSALHHYKLHKQMQDSVHGIQKTNRYLDVRVGYEQNRSSRIIQQIETESKARQEAKQRALYITWAIFLVGIIMTGLLYYAYRQRSRSNEILKQLERTRTDFFTNITHEFRTPLTVIQGFNTLLREKKELSEKEKTTYRLAIERQSNNLLNLVNQLLDITKLKSGKEDPVWKQGDIISYLRMTAETFRLFAEEKKVNLVFYSDIAMQEMDFIPFYIDKIVSNLLSNAIKHTEAGDKIDFIVVKGTRPDTIVIRVADTGDGIPKEDLERIFELFYQSENARNTTGSGIGLSFTQMMVEKMKGEIEVDSELGKGTSFTVTLPLKNNSLPYIEPLQKQSSVYSILKVSQTETASYDEETEVAIDEETDETRQPQPIILVVEDNSDVRTYIKSLISGNYKVITAKNGQEGLEMAEKHIPDLVITDVMMPVKDGTRLCCEMKQSVMLNHIPVIMLTAKSSDEDRIKGLRCGAEAFIKKPFDPEELLICMHNLLEGRKTLIEKYRKTLENNTSSAYNKINSDANLKYLQTITDIIYAEMQNPALNSTFIAEKMAVSISQLNRKLNAITGQSTISYILKVKLSKAKKMLQETSGSVADVAEACGFYDANYFSRVFKKEFGMSPSQFQKSFV